MRIADKLLKQIGFTIPVTPVCLTSRAVLMMNNYEFQRADLIKKIVSLRKKLKNKKRRIVLGKAFERSIKSQEKLKSEKKDRQRELVSFEEEFLESGEARNTAKVALEILSRRKIVRIKNNTIVVNKKMKPLLEYYSNSLNKLL